MSSFGKLDQRLLGEHYSAYNAISLIEAASEDGIIGEQCVQCVRDILLKRKLEDKWKDPEVFNREVMQILADNFDGKPVGEVQRHMTKLLTGVKYYGSRHSEKKRKPHRRRFETNMSLTSRGKFGRRRGHRSGMPLASRGKCVFGLYPLYETGHKSSGGSKENTRSYRGIDGQKLSLCVETGIENDIYTQQMVDTLRSEHPAYLLNGGPFGTARSEEQPDRRRVAFVDFDKTNYDGFLLKDLVNYMAASGRIAHRYDVKFSELERDMKSGAIDYGTFAQRAGQLMSKMLRGKPREWFKQIVRGFFYNREYRGKHPLINPVSRDIHEETRKTAKTVLVTGELREIMEDESVRRYLPYDDLIATEFEVDKRGKYTGRMTRNTLNTTSRAKEVRAYMRANYINPDSTIGIGDSSADIDSIFKYAAYSVIRNPSKALARWADNNDCLVFRDTDSISVYKAFINNPLAHFDYVRRLAPEKKTLVQRIYDDAFYGGDWGQAIKDVNGQMSEEVGLSGGLRRWLYGKRTDESGQRLVKSYKDLGSLLKDLKELHAYERLNGVSLNAYERHNDNPLVGHND